MLRDTGPGSSPGHANQPATAIARAVAGPSQNDDRGIQLGLHFNSGAGVDLHSLPAGRGTSIREQQILLIELERTAAGHVGPLDKNMDLILTWTFPAGHGINPISHQTSLDDGASTVGELE